MKESEIIDSIGSQTEIALTLGIPRQRVFQFRNDIPWMSRYAIVFVAMLKHTFPNEVPKKMIPGYLAAIGLPEDFLDRKAYDKKQAKKRKKK